jgi:hypothetical protein
MVEIAIFWLQMKLCLMILSVPWFMFNGLEHTAILSHFITFITGSSSRLLRIRFSALFSFFDDVKNYSIFQLSQFCIFILHFAIKVKLVWDEVPTMVEIAILWFQIHSTNGSNSLHRKWQNRKPMVGITGGIRLRKGSRVHILPSKLVVS